MQEGGTNWLDVLRSAIWPVVALVFLAVFWEPLSSTLSDLEEVQSFKAGGVEITFAVERAKRLSAPGPDVAQALRSLTPRDRDALLSAGNPRSVTYCSARGLAAARESAAFRADPNMGRLSPAEIDSYVELAAAYERLAALSLAAASQEFPPYVPKPEWCQQEFFYIRTTPLGDATRTYLIDLINAGITISTAS